MENIPVIAPLIPALVSFTMDHVIAKQVMAKAIGRGKNIAAATWSQPIAIEKMSAAGYESISAATCHTIFLIFLRDSTDKSLKETS